MSDTHAATHSPTNDETADSSNAAAPPTTATTVEENVSKETLAALGPVAAELAQEFSIQSLSAPALKETEGQIQTVALQMDGIRTQVGQVPYCQQQSRFYNHGASDHWKLGVYTPCYLFTTIRYRTSCQD